MPAYYNEIDPYAAQWLRNLIAAGHIAPGDVDERSIRDVTPADLAGYTQCHFFAGVGVWSYALRLAGWPDDRPVWTGSCPCQPFSAAGRGDGAADPRHLWPTWIKLIRECRPSVCFGEQVASSDGLSWLDLVYYDLEAAGYAVGALDICAAGFGAPHIRQRLYFVADANGTISKQSARNWTRPGETKGWRTLGKSNGRGNSRRLADAQYSQRRAGTVGRSDDHTKAPGRDEGTSGTRERGGAGELGDAEINGLQKRTRKDGQQGEEESGQGGFYAAGTGQTNGFWHDAEWIACRDGKARATKPGLFPLAHGAAARVGRLRAYGNAIVPQVAEGFIRAFMETGP